MSNNIFRAEAVKRMKIHKLSAEVIQKYELGEVMCSEKGMIRECTDKEKKLIAAYEKESGCFVYHLIHAFANIGETYEILRVSNYVEDWSYENDGLELGQVLVHSINVTHPNWSESGSILVKKIEGLLRIG